MWPHSLDTFDHYQRLEYLTSNQKPINNFNYKQFSTNYKKKFLLPWSLTFTLNKLRNIKTYAISILIDKWIISRTLSVHLGHKKFQQFQADYHARDNRYKMNYFLDLKVKFKVEDSFVFLRNYEFKIPQTQTIVYNIQVVGNR